MTLLGFLEKQCPNAPPLLEFNKENYEYTFTVDKDYAFDNDTIGEFIGKIINAIFLKDYKEDKSLFAIDCVILNYSVKEYINETKNKWEKNSLEFSARNKKAFWLLLPVLDKGENKVKSIIINPLLDYFIKELKLYLQKENNKMIIARTKKSDNYIDSDNDIKQIEYNESYKDNSDNEDADSDKSSEGWISPKETSDDED
jgi:hypothetical protein